MLTLLFYTKLVEGLYPTVNVVNKIKITIKRPECRHLDNDETRSVSLSELSERSANSLNDTFETA